MVKMKILAQHTTKDPFDIATTTWTVHARCITLHPNNNNNNKKSHNNRQNDHLDNTHSNVPTIETVWEVSNMSTTGSCSTNSSNHHHSPRQRIAVYSGPEHSQSSSSSSSKLLLMSMSLPSDTSIPPPPLSLPSTFQNDTTVAPLSSSVLVWVHFDDRTDGDINHNKNHQSSHHKVLCCLCNPNSLYIWDVFPNTENDSGTDRITIPSEGWMITLPFDCRTIVALNDENGNGSGLLLQRMPDVDDVLTYQHNTTPQQQQQAKPMHRNVDDNDVGFVLLGPPSTWQHKLQQLPSTSATKTEHTNQDGNHEMMHMDTILPNANTKSTPTWNVHHPFSPTIQQYQSHPPVVSLFTLHHPLEDVIPVTINSNNNNNNNNNDNVFSSSTATEIAVDPVTDVFEQVLWIGTAEWMNDHLELGEINRDAMASHVRQQQQQQIMVTYHTMEHRHAIHVITNAPPPPVIPPLYEQTRRRTPSSPPKRNSMSSNINNNFGPMRDIVNLSIDDDEELDDENDISNQLNMMIDADDNDDDDDDDPSDLFGRTKTTVGQLHKMDHEVALADALGVNHPLGHRSSRASTSPRPQQPYLSINSGGNHHHHHPNHLPYRAKAPMTTMMVQDHAGHSGFLSPSFVTSNTINNINNKSTPMNMDVSHHTTATSAIAANTLPTTAHQLTTSSNGFFHTKLMNALHPRIAIQCLYQEKTSTLSACAIPCATVVCLISNVTATGTLVLAMLRGDNTLVLYSLIPGPIRGDNLEGILSVQLLSYIPSVASIVPICAFPTPLRNSSLMNASAQRQRRHAVWKTTDLLLLQKEGLNCALYRANIPICECYVAEDNEGIDMTTFRLIGLSDPVVNTYSLHFQENQMKKRNFMARGQLSLTLQNNSPITERVLSCLDATMYSAEASMNLQCIQLALKIRTDCHRFYDAIMQMQLSEVLPMPERLLFHILQFLIVQTLRHHIGGIAAQPSVMISSETSLDFTNGSSDWEALLKSDFHHSYPLGTRFYSSNQKTEHGDGTRSCSPYILSIFQTIQSTIGSVAILEIQKNESWNGVPLLSMIFDSIHLLYEDTKLSAACSTVELTSLASLLIELTIMVQQVDSRNAEITEHFLDYYQNKNEFGKKDQQRQITSFDMSNAEPNRKLTSFTTPPSIFRWAQSVLANIGNDSGNYGIYGNISDWRTTNPVCAKTRLVLRIFPLVNISICKSMEGLRVVQALLEEGFAHKSMVREEFCSGISLPLLEILYRCRRDADTYDIPGWTSEAWILVGRRDLAMNSNPCQTSLYNEADASFSATTRDDSVDASNDGLADVERSAAIIFPEDNRVHEAARLLCSSRPIFLRVARAIEVSDHDFERLKQRRLLVLSYRALALPTGRGMLTIGRFRPIPTEPLPIPVLCLKGRVPPTNSTITLDTSECPTDMQVWPEFHNGVAAGLRLPLKNDPYYADFTIPRTWILYNRPPLSRTPAPTPQDTGEEAMSSTQAQSYSHGGFLLALGLRGHLAALEMSDVYEYLTQGCATTTVGVLLGMAANKRGTCDLSISKMLCLHIPSLIPQHFSAIDVASIVQTSAIVGAGLLFQGSSHRMMTEFLLNEIGKRPDADINTSDRESYILACGLALGTVNLCLGEAVGNDSKRLGLADLHIEERLIRYIIGGFDKDEVDRTRESNDRFSLPNSMVGSDNEKCSTIYESNLINTSVTSPGATLALGLMYMKTNNKAVAESLNLPDTHFLLEFVRPDFLGFRVMSRALILWDEVEASRKWVDEQIPMVVRDAYEQIGVAATAAFSTRWPKTIRKQIEEYDRRAIKQMYVHIVSSACFAMGLRFAGTGNADAKEAIMCRVMELNALREATDPVSLAMRPEIPILESCLGCAAIALAMVLTGTGDLDALRVFKILRWRCDNDSQYGIHMVFGMCVGLLFLGGGTCTIGRDPADIAALITAFFPRFPLSTADNQYHLQALRHLYALAVKRTEVRAIDVDTKENVQVPIQICFGEKSRDQIECGVPCLLRNSGSSHQELRVLSDKYFPYKLDLSKQNGIYSFFVQKRYAAQSKCFIPGSSSGIFKASIPGMTSNHHPFLQAFSENFQDDSMIKRSFVKGNEHQALDCDFLSRVISACQKSDCPEDVLPLYLKIWYGINKLYNMDQVSRACVLWDVRLLQCYYLNHQTSLEASLLDTKLLMPYLFECTARLALQRTNGFRSTVARENF